MILVTGATGTNGTELIKQLKSANVPVRAMVRDTAKAKDLGVPLVAGDFDKPETFGAALAGVDKVFLPVNADSRVLTREASFLKTPKAAGVKHILRFSAMGAGA